MKTWKRNLAVSVLSLGFLVGNSGCESDAQTGALIGAGLGAIAGQAISGDTEGTLIGACVGAAGGYMIGNEKDKKEDRERAASDRAQIRQEMNTVMVNVTNSNGSIIQVPLRKQGVGYVGTRGEYYKTLPTEDQLRPIYGF